MSARPQLSEEQGRLVLQAIEDVLHRRGHRDLKPENMPPPAPAETRSEP